MTFRNEHARLSHFTPEERELVCEECGDTWGDHINNSCLSSYRVVEDSNPGVLPTDAAARKALPVYSGFIRYFPDAMVAVAELSMKGNEQHNPGKPLHWDRSKSGDELDAAARHLLEAGTIDTDGVRHSAKLAWRAMANLQKEIEGSRK